MRYLLARLEKTPLVRYLLARLEKTPLVRYLLARMEKTPLVRYLYLPLRRRLSYQRDFTRALFNFRCMAKVVFWSVTLKAHPASTMLAVRCL